MRSVAPRRRGATLQAAAFALAGLALLAAAPPAPLTPVAGCDRVAGAHLLDFWFGAWDVRAADGTLAGRDVGPADLARLRGRESVARRSRGTAATPGR